MMIFFFNRGEKNDRENENFLRSNELDEFKFFPLYARLKYQHIISYTIQVKFMPS